jgi:nucleoside-diphosphate-sugar epimerase
MYPGNSPVPVVLLGGSGFVGTRLGALLEQNKIPFLIGDLKLSPQFPERFRHCDVRDLEAVRDLVRGTSVIVNLAAEHRDDVRPRSLYNQVNVEGARLVCEAARLTGVKRIVFTSSVAVYGFQPRPVDEDGPYQPFNDYGRTKLEAEEAYKAWASEDPERVLVVVRPTVIFGEGNRGNVYNLVRQVASKKFFMIGKGDNVKSIAYVGNVSAFLLSLFDRGPGLHVYNYVDLPDLNTRELLAWIQHCLGRDGRLPNLPRSIAMCVGYLFDLAARVTGRKFPVSSVRVRKFCESTQFRADRVAETGFQPPYPLKEALERTIRFEFPVK